MIMRLNIITSTVSLLELIVIHFERKKINYGIGFTSTIIMNFYVEKDWNDEDLSDENASSTPYYTMVSTMIHLAHKHNWDMAYYDHNEIIGFILLDGKFKIDKRNDVLLSPKYLSIIKRLKASYEVTSLN